MKVAELFEAKAALPAKAPKGPSASEIRKNVVTAFKAIGYKLKSQESSPGAMKAWIQPTEYPGYEWTLESWTKMVQQLSTKTGQTFAVRKTSDDDFWATGPGCSIDPQGNGTIFVSASRKGRAGDLWKQGMDT